MNKPFDLEPLNASVIHDLDSREYHADKSRLNASSIKIILRSPSHYKTSLSAESKSTPEMEFGTLYHTCTLEPEKVQEDCNRLSKKAVEKLPEAQAMALATLNTKLGSMIKEGKGEAEITIHWDEQFDLDGELVIVKCKARLDYTIIGNNVIIIDLKSTKDASESEFSKSIENFQYHISAFWYKRAVYAWLGRDSVFAYIACEKVDPYATAQYISDIEDEMEGKEKCSEALMLYAKAMLTDEWKGYGDDIKTIERPYWARRKK